MVGELRMNLRNFLYLRIMKSGTEDQKGKINRPKWNFPKCIAGDNMSMNNHIHIHTFTAVYTIFYMDIMVLYNSVKLCNTENCFKYILA